MAKQLYLVLKAAHTCFDASKPIVGWDPNASLGPGRIPAERIPNPTDPLGDDWIVKKGTQIGMSEQGWKAWTLWAFRAAQIQFGRGRDANQTLDQLVEEIGKGNVHKLTDHFREREVVIEEAEE